MTTERFPVGVSDFNPETPSRTTFLEKIGRQDLKEVLTWQTPWVDFTMETYLQEIGIVGGGGLGMVKGDTVLQAEKLQVPFLMVSLFYPQRMRQVIDKDFFQRDILAETTSPQEAGFEKVGETTIMVNGDRPVVHAYKAPGLPLLALYEEGLQYVYPGGNHTDHRIYQQVFLGFGGYKIIKELNLKPSVIQMDEAVAVFPALARFDDLALQSGDLDEARAILKGETLLTNHTLVPAAVATFSRDQFERYVMPNLETEQVKGWLRHLIDSQGGALNLSTMAFELSGRLNGVSKVHAQFASLGKFRRADGSVVKHESVTNGVFLERWVTPHLLEMYRGARIIDDEGLATQNYRKGVRSLNAHEMQRDKKEAKRVLRDYLPTRRDQYGRGINIDENAKIAVWTKRIAGYKRPSMLFEDPNRLAGILEEGDVHVILAGKAHPTDDEMKVRLQSILLAIDVNEVLRKRVHFIQDYDENLARRLVPAVDICFNTPQVRDERGKMINTEADGTFWKKAIAGNAILVSTRDGGVADVPDRPYIEVTGRNYREEVESLYSGFELATREIDDVDRWGARVKAQLGIYMPTISGARMIKDYLNLGIPRR